MYESLRFQGGVGGAVIPAPDSSLPGQARQPSLCRHSGGSRNPGVAGAGIQSFQYVTKGLDPGVRPRIQAFRGRLGDDKKTIFSHVRTQLNIALLGRTRLWQSF